MALNYLKLYCETDIKTSLNLIVTLLSDVLESSE